MVYKLVREWKSESGDAHEITVYKYNMNHDEIVRYNYEAGQNYIDVKSQMFGDYQNGMIEYKVYLKVAA